MLTIRFSVNINRSKLQESQDEFDGHIRNENSILLDNQEFAKLKAK